MQTDSGDDVKSAKIIYIFNDIAWAALKCTFFFESKTETWQVKFLNQWICKKLFVNVVFGCGMIDI